MTTSAQPIAWTALRRPISFHSAATCTPHHVPTIEKSCTLAPFARVRLLLLVIRCVRDAPMSVTSTAPPWKMTNSLCNAFVLHREAPRLPSLERPMRRLARFVTAMHARSVTHKRALHGKSLTHNLHPKKGRLDVDVTCRHTPLHARDDDSHLHDPCVSPAPPPQLPSGSALFSPPSACTIVAR